MLILKFVVFSRSLAIVNGAVQHGVDQHKAGNTSSWGIVRSRKARYHYGIAVSELFRTMVHPLHKRYIDPYTGYPMCRDRMHWTIKKVSQSDTYPSFPSNSFERGTICIKGSASRKHFIVHLQSSTQPNCKSNFLSETK